MVREGALCFYDCIRLCPSIELQRIENGLNVRLVASDYLNMELVCVGCFPFNGHLVSVLLEFQPM